MLLHGNSFSGSPSQIPGQAEKILTYHTTFLRNNQVFSLNINGFLPFSKEFQAPKTQNLQPIHNLSPFGCYDI
jgi:hypothetical protein